MELNITITIMENVKENVGVKINGFTCNNTMCCDDYISLINDLTNVIREHAFE